MNRFWHKGLLLIMAIIISFQLYGQKRIDLPSGLKSESGIIVFVSLGTDCPISQKYIHTLKAFHSAYKDKVTLIGIIPFNFDSDEIESFRKDFDIPFPLQHDSDNTIIEALEITVTPEVVMTDHEGYLIYRGAIDNWFYELGKSRWKPTAFYLEDALQAVMNGKKVVIDSTQAIGCMIEKKYK